MDWSPFMIAFWALAVAGGALIEGAVQLGLSALTFRLLDTSELRNFVDNVFSVLGSYPLKIFGRTVEWMLTFVLPVAFVAYLPVNALLQPTDRDAGGLALAPWVGYLGAPLGVAMFAAAYTFWHRQPRQYQSVGH